jgi:hypothetical protein
MERPAWLLAWLPARPWEKPLLEALLLHSNENPDQCFFSFYAILALFFT